MAEHPQEFYHCRVWQMDDGDGPYWLAMVEELAGCMSDGETEAEAIENVRDAMKEWVAAASAEGRPVPHPRLDSGELRVRLPVDLHGVTTNKEETGGSTIYEPEFTEGQDEADKKKKRDAFYCYVLATKHGHYIGHTGRLDQRLREHFENGGVSGNYAKLIWLSRRYYTRESATKIEAQMKTYRQDRLPVCKEITGYTPKPWK